MVAPSAPATTRITVVTTLGDDSGALRQSLVDRLCEQGSVRTPGVETVLRSVPRDLFLPGVPLDQAYADNPVATKTDAAGTAVSAASQPTIVAVMLEQLDVRPGQRILEIGAGTGYNAALLGSLVGPTGRVTTVDVDPDIVDGARAHLAAAGLRNVDVVLGDGVRGHPGGAPYDRCVATVGAYETPSAWWEQLRDGGRLVVPLRLRGAASRSIAFDRAASGDGGGGWRGVSSELAYFMPLRGIGDDAPRTVALGPGDEVTVEVHRDQAVDGPALAGVLDAERHDNWTGVLFPPLASYEWLDLWLACALPGALMRMSVQWRVGSRRRVAPLFSWGSMATVRGADLAYLTARPASRAADGSRLREVGVIGHGPGGRELAETVAGQIRRWDQGFRSRAVRFGVPDRPVAADPAAGRFVLDRPDRPVTVSWG